MVLAQWFLNDAEYAKQALALQKYCLEGEETLILDNGAYEGEQVYPFDLVTAARGLSPDMVVIPDVPNVYKANEYMAKRFLCSHGATLLEEGHRLLKIIHGSNLAELTAAYTQALIDPKIHAIGISRLTPTKVFTPFPLHDRQPWLDFDPRANFILSVNQALGGSRAPKKYLHAFGCPGGLSAINDLRLAGFDSVDGAGPIWRGLNRCNLSYHGVGAWRAKDIEFDVHSTLEGLSIGLAARNVLEACDTAGCGIHYLGEDPLIVVRSEVSREGNG